MRFIYTGEPVKLRMSISKKSVHEEVMLELRWKDDIEKQLIFDNDVKTIP